MLVMNTIDIRSYSADLNGVDERFKHTAQEIIGIANVWSVGVWQKVRTIATGIPLVFSGKSIIVFWTLNNTAIRWVNRDTNAADIKTYVWNNIIVVDEWQFHVATWDGTDLLAYVNGVDLGPPDSAPQDNAGVMADDIRRISIGGDIPEAQFVDCVLHSTMVWDVALGPAEILAAYNEGNGAGFNVQQDSGNYVSSANLQHWWRFGEDRTEIGRDFTTVGTPINVDVNATNLSVDDIIVDGPGRG